MTMQEDCVNSKIDVATTRGKIFAEPSRKAIVADLLDASVIRKSPYKGFDISTGVINLHH